MKYTCALLTLLFPTLAAAQSVGINTPNTGPAASAVLDVRASAKGVSFPNISLASATDASTIASPLPGLMVYNTNAALPCGAGLYFNNGTAATPAWLCFTKSVQNLHAYDTGRTASTPVGSTPTLQPGCSLTLTVPAGQTVDIKVDAMVGAVVTASGSTAYSTIDAVVMLDGNTLAKGGYNRFVLENSVAAYGQGSTTVSTWIPGVTAGTHTVQLYTALANSAATVGGNAANASTTNAGEIHATVYYR